MKLPRRAFLRLAAGAAALPAVSRIALAQTYRRHPFAGQLRKIHRRRNREMGKVVKFAGLKPD